MLNDEKTAITRATVGTSKDQWKDEHDKLYSSKYVNIRNANWMKQINNIYAKPIPAIKEKNINNYSKNRTGSRILLHHHETSCYQCIR